MIPSSNMMAVQNSSKVSSASTQDTAQDAEGNAGGSKSSGFYTSKVQQKFAAQRDRVKENCRPMTIVGRDQQK